MDWNKAIGPKHITTPDINREMKRLFYPEDNVETVLEKLDHNSKEKLRLLAERLEFVDHLRVIVQEFRRLTKTTVSYTRGDTDRCEKTETYELRLWGHDLNGADYDIEALCLYLLVTCIDTIMGKLEYKTAFEWLQEYHADDFVELHSAKDVVSVLGRLGEDYHDNFGLTRNFRTAFLSHLPQCLKDRLRENFAVVHIADGAVAEDSRKNWEGKGADQRLKRLVDTLYELRSGFTHHSIRWFLPTQPVCRLPKMEKRVIVGFEGGEDLFCVLREIIVFLTRSVVMGIHP